MFHLSGHQATPWYHFGGFSIIYIFTESYLLAYPQRQTNARRSLSHVLSVVHTFRLGIITLLVGTTISSKLIPGRCRNSDEESLPLLQDDGGQSNDHQRQNYSTIHDTAASCTNSPNRDCAGSEGELNDPIKVCQPMISTIPKAD